MICTTPGCSNQADSDSPLCLSCLFAGIPDVTGNDIMTLGVPTLRAEDKAEYSGNHVDYYKLHIPDPKRLEPYTCECEDIIEALNMTFAEGNAFKAIWRSAAARELGLKKKGQDEHGIYDAEKVSYYGQAMLRQRKRRAATAKK